MIYVVAYLKGNFGDDLFVRTLLRRYPNESFYLCSNPQNLKAFQLEKNLVYPNPITYFLIRVFTKITRDYFGFNNVVAEFFSKSVVVIGGSIFIEGTSNSFMKKCNSKTFIMGANYGPAYTLEYQDRVKKVLAQTVSTSFRDSYSYKTFSTLENVKYAPDILFSLDSLPKTKTGVGVGISIIDLANRKDLSLYTESFENAIACYCDRCADNNISIKLFNFCDYEGDGTAIERITKRLANPGFAEIVNYSGDLDYVINKMNDCEYIVASRFHAMILGWDLGKKVLPVVYSNKHLNVISDLNFDGELIDLREGTDGLVDRLERGVFESKCISNIEDIKIKSIEHFSDLDKLLI